MRRSALSDLRPLITFSLLLSATLLRAPWTLAAPKLNEPERMRWLWVPGSGAQEERCDAPLREAHQALTRRLGELLPVEVISDGQTIPCRDERCVRARVTAAGAQVGLLSTALCTERSLSIELMITPLDEAPLRYREGMSLAELSAQGADEVKATQARRGPRGGLALSSRLSPAQGLGVKLARAITLGPAPRPKPAQPSAYKLGAWLAVNLETPSQPELLGVSAQLELLKAPPASSLEYFGTIGFEHSQSPRSAQRRLLSALGLHKRLGSGSFVPLIGGAFELSYQRSLERVDELIEQISLDEAKRSSVSIEETWVREDEGFELRPALDVGALWRGSAVDLKLITRLSPLTLVPIATQRATWQLLFGVRW